MDRHRFGKRLSVALLSLAMAAGGASALPSSVSAENIQFITDIRVAAGEDAFDKLEKDGYSVRAVGLNASVSEEDQVYLGYKLNDGDPVTDVIISDDVGDSLKTDDGITYTCAGHTDVDKGNGDGGGCVYLTRDTQAGDALVGLDVLRSDRDNKDVLLPILNDGAEVVRNADGTPADLEKGDTVIYLAQMRDGMVKPYIAEVGIVTGENKEDAVFQAATNGYNYYVEGDLDSGKETYTILVYARTDEKENAVTNLMAVSAELTGLLEKGQVIAGQEQETGDGTETGPEETAPEETEPEETATEEAGQEEAGDTDSDTQAEESADTEEPAETEGEAEDMSDEAASEEEEDAESAEEAAAEQPSDESGDGAAEEAAAEEEEEAADVSDTTVKLTAEALDISGVEYDRISDQEIKAKTPYYFYMTKDQDAGNPITMLYAGDDTEVTETTLGAWAYGYFSSKGVSSAYSYTVNEDRLEKLKSKETVYLKMPVTLLTGAEDKETNSFTLKAAAMSVSMLTGKKGLPDTDIVLNGLTEPTYEPPQIDRNEKKNGASDLPASAFGEDSSLAVISGGIVVAAAAAAVLIKKRRKARVQKQDKASD